MRPERVDVLVIGAGAAGAAITKSLAEKGASVMCLEQGDWRKASDYPSTGSDYEAQMRRPQFSFSPNQRKRTEDYPVVSAGPNPPDIEMVNGVGGTTVHWNAEFLRMRRLDFRVKALDGVAADWPIRYEELAPYYEANERNSQRRYAQNTRSRPGDYSRHARACAHRGLLRWTGQYT
jgi:choline dehydrogenase-like flavoprotein